MRLLLTLVLGIIGLILVSWCFAGVDQPSLVTDPSLLALIRTTGDDAFATTNLTTLIDPTTNATQHYGPYNCTSTDSGTCGNDWANDSSIGTSRLEGTRMVRSWWSSGSRTVASSPLHRIHLL